MPLQEGCSCCMQQLLYAASAETPKPFEAKAWCSWCRVQHRHAVGISQIKVATGPSANRKYDKECVLPLQFCRLLTVACMPLLICASNAEHCAQFIAILSPLHEARIYRAGDCAYCPVTYLHKKRKAGVNGCNAYPRRGTQLKLAAKDFISSSACF